MTFDGGEKGRIYWWLDDHRIAGTCKSESAEVKCRDNPRAEADPFPVDMPVVSYIEPFNYGTEILLMAGLSIHIIHD